MTPPSVDVLPSIDSGVTHLSQPSARSTALHRLVVNELAEPGTTDWVDARNTASTYTLYELAPSERRLDQLRIARAFTAYQHYELARQTVQRASARTHLLVFPNLASLYRDDDVPGHEATALLGSVVQGLTSLAEDRDLRVLVTTQGDDDLATLVRDAADHTIEAERTGQGLRYTAPEFETTVYWAEGYWQTTIPYWVELYGAVGETETVAAAEAFGIEGVA